MTSVLLSVLAMLREAVRFRVALHLESSHSAINAGAATIPAATASGLG
jgi:hypothetical protein